MRYGLREALNCAWPGPFVLLQLAILGSGRVPSKYYYREQLGDREVRLISIDEGKGSALVSCRLQKANLDNDIEFAALSYAWGHVAKRNPILCDGKILYVTNNLFAALWELRESKGAHEILIWVDAISINQTDRSEKTAQVRMMSDIYRTAHPVIAWLGPEISSDEEGLSLLLAMESVFKSAQRDGQLKRMAQAQDRGLEALGLPGSNHPAWGSLKKIILRSWFSRVWIIQEYLLAEQVLFILGSKVIEEGTLLGTAWQADHFGVMQSALASKATGTDAGVSVAAYHINSAQLFDLRARILRKESLSLFDLLHSAQSFQAFDPLDRLFALMEISHDFSKELIDYSQTVESVLINVTILTLTGGATSIQTPSLDILSQAEISTKSDTLPSWIPDLTKEHVHYPLSYIFPTPQSCTEIDRCILVSNQMSLTLSGKIIDRIKTIIKSEGIIVPLEADETALHAACPAIVRWESKCFAIANMSSRYPTGERTNDIYWRTLICNSTFDFDRPSPEFANSFASWLKLFKVPLDIIPKAHSTALGKISFVTFRALIHGSIALLTIHRLAHKSRRLLVISSFFAAHGIAYTIFQALGRYFGFDLPTRSEMARAIEATRKFNSIFQTIVPGRNYCRTENGYLGWVPQDSEEGDSVCAFDGCRVLFTLKKSSEGYTLLGDTYLHGMMDFEWIGRTDLRRSNIELI